MTPKKLEVKNFKLDEIHPYENNPRFNKDAVSKVAASIKKFGFKNPILVDKNNVIIAGHTRLEAAKKLKLEEVPCIVAADLTEKQAKALRLAEFCKKKGIKKITTRSLTGAEFYCKKGFDVVGMKGDDYLLTMEIKT